ncbi:protein sorting system archaetidylserine decarboxylase [Candidatus Halobonum tyrrellensis]|uniref:Phosphatidylserine decarboxylase n=1 Tax=Candidatus Halobonum tyrrellensis G22 TaxID=1324957 RepID=V4IXM0_9EURY|nr:protein sorting system archaetidylserine decarboxylase [Candidatus Halobonum tyrrellensis]ESP87907.1 phosphatidylserine decarboxylase [Candidatus Halobonum tyrrellensis G22]
MTPGPLPDRLAPGAGRVTLPLLAAAALAALVVPPAGALLLLAAGFSLWFFRDPDREPAGAGVLAPADGRVSVLREEGDRLRVGVFMSPFDVHVNRAPVGGEVREVTHRGAAHRPAFCKDSDRNERVEFAVAADESDDGGTTEFGCALVAGWFARRITPYVSGGERVTRGGRVGHIAFGSRADVLLPPSYDREDVRVREGERVYAGRSVLARRE